MRVYAGDANEPGQFASALQQRLDDRQMTLKELANEIEASYEHCRKLVRGSASPSPLLLKQICSTLDLDLEKMKRLVTADQNRSRYGTIPDELSGKNPDLARMERLWPGLNTEQKEVLEVLAETLVARNRRHKTSK